MKFLDVFNEIQKGNYALTDEAIYASLQNGDELIPLYGGNKDHKSTERKISVSAKTKRGIQITVFSEEGIIISLDGSAGSMTYKNGERFALNHHAGFITLRKDAVNRINLEYFSLFLQNFYRGLGVSDGSKTLSLTKIYSEEFSLPSYEVQCSILNSLNAIKTNLNCIVKLKSKYQALINKELTVEYQQYQGQNIDISTCIDYMSGTSLLTEEKNYQRLKTDGEQFKLLTGATDKVSTLVTIGPQDNINRFSNREGLLVTCKGKAGCVEYLCPDKYVINDDAYILYIKNDCKYDISLQWLALQYRQEFIFYASNSDNGTWNMTGFFLIPNLISRAWKNNFL